MKLHSFDICQLCNQLYRLYCARCLLRSGDKIELALWKNVVFVLASDQLLAIHIQQYVSILLWRGKIHHYLSINNCTLKTIFHTKNHLTRYLTKGADNFNVRLLSSVALRTKQWQIFIKSLSRYKRCHYMWNNLNFFLNTIKMNSN